MDLDASFISFKRLSFLPLISGLKVAGFGLNSAALQDVMKITSLERLYIGHDKRKLLTKYHYFWNCAFSDP